MQPHGRSELKKGSGLLVGFDAYNLPAHVSSVFKTFNSNVNDSSVVVAPYITKPQFCLADS